MVASTNSFTKLFCKPSERLCAATEAEIELTSASKVFSAASATEYWSAVVKLLISSCTVVVPPDSGVSVCKVSVVPDTSATKEIACAVFSRFLPL